MHPARARWAEARQLVESAASPSAAWRQLARASLLPSSWLDDPARRFVHIGDEPHARDPAFVPRGPHPARVAQCALIAADVPGVLAAEAAARTLVERLAPWGAPGFRFALWIFMRRDRAAYASTDTRPGVHYALMFATNALALSARAAGVCDSFPTDLAAASALWQSQSASGAVVPAPLQQMLVPYPASTPGTRAPAPGIRFADLPDPFEALALLVATGYLALEWIGATGDAVGAFPLICPLD